MLRMTRQRSQPMMTSKTPTKHFHRYMSGSKKGAPSKHWKEPLFMARVNFLDVFDHVINTLRQCRDIVRIDGNKCGDAELVATQLAVRLSVNDAVGT